MHKVANRVWWRFDCYKLLGADMDVTAYVSKFFHRDNDGIEQATVRVAFAAVILGYSISPMFTSSGVDNLHILLSTIFMAYAIFAFVKQKLNIPL